MDGHVPQPSFLLWPCTTQVGLCIQPDGGTDPAKRNPALPPASSVCSQINFPVQFIAQLQKSCVDVSQRVVYHKQERQIGEGSLAVLCHIWQPLGPIGLAFWFFFLIVMLNTLSIKKTQILQAQGNSEIIMVNILKDSDWKPPDESLLSSSC